MLIDYNILFDIRSKQIYSKENILRKEVPYGQNNYNKEAQ